jgi:ADP-ribose pyrophosphatase YjhB (NUDIX family)
MNFYVEVGNGKHPESLQVSSVAVTNGSYILMGKRKDSGKWTLPGGHHDHSNESPEDAAVRELKEEAGIEADPGNLQCLGSKAVKCEDGKVRRIHAYHYKMAGGRHTAKNDPDQEVGRWHWIAMESGLPMNIQENLHSPRNVVLENMGLLKKSDLFFVTDIVKGGPGSGPHKKNIDRLVQKVRSQRQGLSINDPKGREEHFNAVWENSKGVFPKEHHEAIKQKVKERVGKSENFDLMKAVGAGGQNFKYIRKYRRGNRWVYIYNDPKGRREIPDKAIQHLKELAEKHGDEKARKIVTEIQEYPAKKIDALLQLAEIGDKGAQKHLKEKLGIDWQREAVERRVAEQDEMDVDSPDAALAHGRIGEAIQAKIFGYLSSHTTSPFSTKLRDAGITRQSIMTEIQKKKTMRGMLQEFHRQMKKVDDAHAGLGQSQNSAVREAGSYGNLAYNEGIKALAQGGNLPAGYPQVHKRTGSTQPEILNKEQVEKRMKKIRAEKERKAKMERERLAEEERRVARAIGAHAQNITDMVSYFGIRNPTPQTKKRVAQNIERFFGKDFKFKNFRDYTTKTVNGVKVNISKGFWESLASSDRVTTIEATWYFKTSSGDKITHASRAIYKKPDGSIVWYNSIFRRPNNSYLARYPGMAKGLYSGVNKFLSEVTRNYTGEAKNNTAMKIGAANDGFSDHGFKGGLVWAKHYFDFANQGDKANWKSTWKREVDTLAQRIGLPESQKNQIKAKIDSYEYPYQFVKTGFTMTMDQAKAYTQNNLDFDFKKIYENKGYFDLGELINVKTAQSWGCIAYVHRNSGRHGHLNEKRNSYYFDPRNQFKPEKEKVIGEPTRRPAPSRGLRRPAAPRGPPRSPGGASRAGSVRVDNWLRANRPRGRSSTRANYTITKARLRRMATWTDADLRELLRMAPMTRQGRGRINNMIRDRNFWRTLR